MHDNHGGHELSSQEKLEIIKSGCSVICRDPQRATCIQSLSIRILQMFSERTWGSSGAILHIRDALLLLPSLRQLELYIPHQPIDLPVFQMLSTSAPEFPFHLFELGLSYPLRLVLRGFLESQDSVEILHVAWGPDPEDDTDRLDVSRLLPRVHWQKIPLDAVKEFVRGRHLQSLNLEGSINQRHQLLWAPNRSSSLLATVHEVSFTLLISSDFNPKLLPFLTFECGISLSAINSLVIQSHRWPDQTSFRDVIFGGLPNLTNLEWSCIKGHQWDDDADEPYLHTFAQDAANASLSLKRLSMTSRSRRTWDFFQITEGVSNQNAGDPLKLAFTDARGSTWFISNSPREKRSYRWDRPMPRCDCIA